MAICKPLLVNQRRGVPNPVLSAQTQQLSSNVPVQKLAMLDYSIGQNNAKAAGAVSSELLSMIDKGMQAALYVDNTKREYKRLSLMEDWQKSNMDFQGRFAQARTPDAQATVIADYETDTQNRIAAYSDSQGTGAKQKAQLADLRNTANTQFSKFSVTHQNSLFKQTAGMLATDTATIARSVVEDVNIDPVSAFKKISDNYGEMVAIGALDAPTARYQQGLLQDKMITGRSGLFARNYAKDVLAEGRELPSDKEFKTQINGVMGLELSERRLKLASRSFTDTYYKELKAFNSQVAAEDAHNKEAISEDLAAFEAEYKEEILNKLLTPERKEELINKAQQFDGVEDGYSGRIKVLLDAVQFGTPSQPVVDHFTVGQGGLDLQAVLQSGGVDYYDLEAVEYAMRNAGGEYAGMNENTILGVVKHYRNENAALITQFSKRAPLLLKTNMVAAMQNNQIFLQSEEAGMSPEFWNAIKKTTALNWENVFAQDPEYGEAFSRVQGVLAQAATQGTGPYNKDEIGDDIAARTVALNSFIQQTIATEFGAATAQKRGKVQAAEDKLVEGDKDQARRNFRLGGTTAKGKPYAGALQDSAKNLTDTLSKQGVDKYQGITERIATDLKRMKAEAQPEWVKKTDKALAAIGSKIVEKIPTMKDVASMVMGNVPTSYITGVKNKKLLNELQDMVGRPLTPDELAGKDEDINEMSRTIIKRDSQLPVIGVIKSFFSGSDAETEKKLENLAYEFKHQSLEGIQKGLESAKPKPEPLPVVEKPRTAIEDLAQGAEDNPLLKGAIELASSVLSPSDAEGASTYQDPNFDPTATGPRGFDQDNQPQEGTRNELAQALGLAPDSAGARFEGGTSEESDIEGYTEEPVDMPPVVMDEIVVSEQAQPHVLSGLPKETQEDIKRQLGDSYFQSNYFTKEHDLVRKDLKQEVKDNIKSFSAILGQEKKLPFTKHLEVLTQMEDGGISEDKTTFVHRKDDPAGVFTAMFGVTTTTANTVFKELNITNKKGKLITFKKGDKITKEQALTVVAHIRKEALDDIEDTLKNSPITLTDEQKEVLVLLAHNVGKLSTGGAPKGMKALKRGDLQAAKIEFFSRAEGPNKSNKVFSHGLFKKNNQLLGLFERFSA